MRVYAEYFIKNNKRYRRKTLLQFGDCIDLIGSAVLMNPGSANPDPDKRIEDISTIERFYKEMHNIEIKPKDIWFNFTTDSTMGFLANIFNGWYINNEKELKGIIQLFNCFYYMSPDPREAEEEFKQNPKYIFNESNLFVNRPVYFGWGNSGKTGGIYHSIAKNIFKKYKDMHPNLSKLYESDFESNNFYHPYYLNTLWDKEKLKIKDDKVKNFIKDFVNVVRKPTE
jgi:hypothetical protein